MHNRALYLVYLMIVRNIDRTLGAARFSLGKEDGGPFRLQYQCALDMLLNIFREMAISREVPREDVPTIIGLLQESTTQAKKDKLEHEEGRINGVIELLTVRFCPACSVEFTEAEAQKQCLKMTEEARVCLWCHSMNMHHRYEDSIGSYWSWCQFCTGLSGHFHADPP